MKINLIDINKELCEWWENDFGWKIMSGDVQVIHGDHYFDTPCDALVSPANSFGIMDGGIDKTIKEKLGVEVQTNAQQMISAFYYGEMPVGAAQSVYINDDDRNIIIAPTMRQPEDISDTYNPYLAMRAILKCALEQEFDEINICGLGTGVGRVSPQRCSWLMAQAYKQIMDWDGRLPAFRDMWEQHKDLSGHLL